MQQAKVIRSWRTAPGYAGRLHVTLEIDPQFAPGWAAGHPEAEDAYLNGVMAVLRPGARVRFEAITAGAVVAPAPVAYGTALVMATLLDGTRLTGPPEAIQRVLDRMRVTVHGVRGPAAPIDPDESDTLTLRTGAEREG